MSEENKQPQTEGVVAVGSKELLAARREIGKKERAKHPNMGWCHRCGRPWNIVHGHATDYVKGRACFPLCDECWSELTPVTRLPYYRQLWMEWEAFGCNEPEETWVAIETSVMQGG